MWEVGGNVSEEKDPVIEPMYQQLTVSIGVDDKQYPAF